MGKNKTTEEFIRDAKLVHGDKYDYSQVEYVNSQTKVKIICPIHGVFEQRPNDHLQGKGCSKCAKIQRAKSNTKTQEEFIEKAKKVHGEEYDYSEVVYKNSKTKVKIICKEHGVFEQSPSNHINSKGCRKCGHVKTAKKRIISFLDFKEESNKTHNNKYEYIEKSYKTIDKKVDIICPKHGVFIQRAINHRKGEGCPKCGNIQRAKSITKSHEEVINQFREIHGDKYDYSKFVYVKDKTKGIIICEIHGEFEQTPNSHLQGKGCPKCKSSKGETKIREYLTNNNILFEEQKTFPDCKDEALLRFDIYIPSLNLIIEYDGIQHFEGVYFGKKKGKCPYWIQEQEYNNLKIVQRRDKIKNDYCAEKKINLLRISYMDKDYIEEILKFNLG